MESKLDATDLSILERLMREGRATWADLAVDHDLTAPGIANRVRRLQELGVIKQFAAWVDPGFVAPVCAFLSITITEPKGHDRLRRQVEKLGAVQECHRAGGAGDYVLKVRCGSLPQLDEVTTALHRQIGGARIVTMVVLQTIKESPAVPVTNPRNERSQ